MERYVEKKPHFTQRFQLSVADPDSHWKLTDPDPTLEIYYLHLDIPIGIVQLVIIFLFKIK